jgi:hypothetical protein
LSFLVSELQKALKVFNLYLKLNIYNISSYFRAKYIFKRVSVFSLSKQMLCV